MLETYQLINFSLGGYKKGTGGFFQECVRARQKDIQCSNFKIQLLFRKRKRKPCFHIKVAGAENVELAFKILLCNCC